MLPTGSSMVSSRPRGWAREKSIVMYTTTWCGDCDRVKRFLKGRGIAFSEVNIEHDDEAAAFVMRVNRGYRSVPTLDIEGTTVAEPNMRQLVEMFD
jgi:mycoredoxin